MTQGLRRRPARIRRLGIGLLMLGAVVGCQGPEKAPPASLGTLPPPRLGASTPAPKTTTQTGSTPVPIDNRPGRNPAIPTADSSRSLTGVPAATTGQFGSYDAPAIPSGNATLRPLTTVTPTDTGTSGWAPRIPPAGPVPELTTPNGMRLPAPADVPQPPGPPPMSVLPPTAAPVAPPALPTVLPK